MRYIVEIDGARHEVELDQGMATVDGGPAVPVSLDALPGTPVHLVRVDGEVVLITGYETGVWSQEPKPSTLGISRIALDGTEAAFTSIAVPTSDTEQPVFQMVIQLKS